MQDDDRPSKTQRKQAMHALQALGARLVTLNDEQLHRVPLEEPLREAVLEARRMRSREAQRRQLQYLGRLMREVDPAPIQAWFDALDGRSAAAIAAQHRVERWRERLLEGDDALAELAREGPGIEWQALRACLREARKERAAGRPPRHYRQLYRLLEAALQARAPIIPDEHS